MTTPDQQHITEKDKYMPKDNTTHDAEAASVLRANLENLNAWLKLEHFEYKGTNKHGHLCFNKDFLDYRDRGYTYTVRHNFASAAAMDIPTKGDETLPYDLLQPDSVTRLVAAFGEWHESVFPDNPLDRSPL
ncbi:hypothetical protein [Leptolyngbya sp. FACHB-261]|uniref:hypothetical protein n=1 Tax=Leptolyngbya sp. FACHB-261 TaxID=2692806 RepID=UPI0016861275|nr:hypothetical protein [Leptolyngbya sp. FACHB-261]MBD2102133.1 hypothetical protein [Leptolyngbya sp. FACHB-261]